MSHESCKWNLIKSYEVDKLFNSFYYK
jgi:hypothetical protein